jgi:hypothetical protein
VSILKILGTVISKPLETLFNVSFSMGIVPSNFKIANILPIYKNGLPLVLVVIFQSLFFQYLISLRCRPQQKHVSWGVYEYTKKSKGVDPGGDGGDASPPVFWVGGMNI